MEYSFPKNGVYINGKENVVKFLLYTNSTNDNPILKTDKTSLQPPTDITGTNQTEITNLTIPNLNVFF